jgi:hypothetical protein
MGARDGKLIEGRSARCGLQEIHGAHLGSIAAALCQRVVRSRRRAIAGAKKNVATLDENCHVSCDLVKARRRIPWRHSPPRSLV